MVIPLFSGYDKWQAWSTRRKVIAVALAVGIAVVAFGQYRRLVNISSSGLEAAFASKPMLRGGPWYARRVIVSLWEWLGTVAAGAVLVSLAIESWRQKKKRRAAGYAALFGLMLALGAALKLRTWSD
ncbi:MAG: hypothetical protein AMXMBFR34_23920 [Myxococcaceae bacterium]